MADMAHQHLAAADVQGPGVVEGREHAIHDLVELVVQRDAKLVLERANLVDAIGDGAVDAVYADGDRFAVLVAGTLAGGDLGACSWGTPWISDRNHWRQNASLPAYIVRCTELAPSLNRICVHVKHFVRYSGN